MSAPECISTTSAAEPLAPATLTIEHRHGTLVLEPVTPVRPIAGLRTDDLPAEWVFRGIDTAEQLAVLCVDHRIQISMASPLRADGAGFLFLHDSASAGRVMRVVAMDYRGPDAGQVIRDARVNPWG